MPARMLSRPAETRAVGDFLSAASSGPAVLVVEGEAVVGRGVAIGLWHPPRGG